MVARPSLKRVVPGSVPPWRALCAESARALQVRADIARAKLARFLGQALVPAGAAGPRRSFCGLAVARPRVVPGSFPPASACFSWPRRCFGLPHVFRGRAVFHFRQSRRRGSLSSSLRLIRSLSTFAVETLLASRGAELPSWRGVAAKRKLEIIAKPLGLLHEALLSGRSFLRTETCSYSLPLQRIACRLPICLVRCSPIFAVRHLYFVGRTAC